MKILSGLLLFILVVAVLCFALSNQQTVTLGCWPFTGNVEVPLYIVGFLPLLFGLLVGGLLGWISGVPHRWRVRQLTRERDILHDKVNVLQQENLAPTMPQPKRKLWRLGL